MKKLTTIFLIILFVQVNYLKAQNAWQILSPLPTGINLYGVSMISPNEFWILGEQGKILHTTDGGISWQIQQAPTFYPISIKMFNANDGWLISGGDTIYKTNDGGLNWLPVFIQYGGYTGGFFRNINEGWVFGNADTLLHTTNGGASWSVDTLMGLASPRITFSDTIHGWVVSADGSVWKTIDGGMNWNKITNAPPGADLNVHSAFFTDSLTGYFSGFSYTTNASSLYKTSDGGFTWTKMVNYPANIYPAGVITFFDSLNGILLSLAPAGYYLTHDGGITWTNYVLPDFGTPYQLDFINNSFVAIGSSALVIKSNDLGLTTSANLFQRITKRPFLRSISFPDTSIGYIYSKGDGLYKTINGGASWTCIDSINFSYPEKLFFITPQKGWTLRGTAATVRITTDGGLTWTNSQPPNYILNDFCFVNQNSGWGIDATGKILSTTDGGIHWQIDTSLTSGNQFFSIHFSDSLNGWAIGSSGINTNLIWNTIDGGDNWQQKYSDTASHFYAPYYKIFSTDINHAWFAGNKNKIIRTNDGGNTWLTTPIFTSNYLYNNQILFFADTLTGYCGGQYLGSDILLKTTDGGISWTTQLQNNGTSINDICYVDSSHIWVAGLPSLVAVYRDGLPTAINALNSAESGIEIFPNPSQNKFTIKNISSDKNTLLEIFNPLGMVIYSEKLNGKNECVVQGKFGKGIYFVRVSDGEKSVVRKVVIE